MFIIGNEYWHNEFKEVPYRGKKNMLWKADYANLYLKWFKDLKLMKEVRVHNDKNGNIDTMFALEKELR